MKKWGNMRPTSSTPLYVVVVRYFLDFFYVFWKNDPLWENFQNSIQKVFIATPIDVLTWQKSPGSPAFANLQQPAPRVYSECSGFTQIVSLLGEL